MKRSVQHPDLATLRETSAIREGTMALSQGDKTVAHGGELYRGLVHFDDPENIYHEILYALSPVTLTMDLSFFVLDDDALGDPIVTLMRVEIIQGEISLSAFIDSARVVEYSKCHPSDFMQTLLRRLPSSMEIVDDSSSGNPIHDECSISFKKTTPFVESIGHHIGTFRDEVLTLIMTVKAHLSGRSWNEKWSTDERAFSTELIEPLLRALGYDSVRNNHGPEEFGKDILCREIDRFGIERWIGFQLKAVDITGEANALVDLIVGQINDAFSIPFYDVASRSTKHIAGLFVICSEGITKNAREKIKGKIPHGLVGSVTFIDRQYLEGLITRHLSAK